MIDTLSSLLDVSTFKEINHSHADVISFNGHVATFNFPNINLIDSTTNDTSSIGWIQYKIKPISGLPNGTHITNRASIYFDYNAPVLTPTASTWFGNVGINETGNTNLINIYPNPFTAQTTITFKDDASASSATLHTIKVINLLGECIQQQTTNSKQVVLDMTNYAKGIYFVRIQDASSSRVVNRKIVLQ